MKKTYIYRMIKKGLIIIFYMLFLINYAPITAYASSEHKELIVLIDSSGSMNENNCENSDKAKEWAKEITIFCYGLDVNLTLYTFESKLGNDSLLSEICFREKVNDKNYMEIIHNIECIKFDGIYTDQLGALRETVDRFEDLMEPLNIVILSDGTIDYTNDGDALESTEEIGAKDDFVLLCEYLAEQNNSIFLVAFIDEIEMFYRLNDIKNIAVLNKKDPFNTLLEQLFLKMNLPIITNSDEIVSNLDKINFYIKNDVYKSIIKVFYDEHINLNDIQLYKDGNELSSDEYKILLYSRSIVIITLIDPPPACYTIKFPDSISGKYEWRDIIRQDINLDISLYGQGINIIQKEDEENYYIIESLTNQDISFSYGIDYDIFSKYLSELSYNLKTLVNQGDVIDEIETKIKSNVINFIVEPNKIYKGCIKLEIYGDVYEEPFTIEVIEAPEEQAKEPITPSDNKKTILVYQKLNIEGYLSDVNQEYTIKNGLNEIKQGDSIYATDNNFNIYFYSGGKYILYQEKESLLTICVIGREVLIAIVFIVAVLIVVLILARNIVNKRERNRRVGTVKDY